MNPKDYYSCADLACCSLLVGAGYQVEFTEKIGGKGIFYFKRDQGIDSLLEAFWARRPIPVIPAALFEISKHLKAMVDGSK